MKKQPLRPQLIDELTLRNYSENTVKTYVCGVRRIAARFRRSPDQISTDELRSYLLELCWHRPP